MFSAVTLADILGHWGPFAVIGSILISILVALLGILPSVFVTGANVILFGPYLGMLISWTGEVVGAFFSFHLYRFGFKRKTERFAVKYGLLKRLTAAKGSTAGWIIFQARIIPFIPSGFVTAAASVSNTNQWTFLLATAAGKFPSLVLETLISFDLVNINKNWLRLLLTLLALSLSYLVLRKSKANKNL